MSEKKLLQSVTIPGTVVQLHAQIQRLELRYSCEWRSSEGEYLRFQWVTPTIGSDLSTRGRCLVTNALTVLSDRALRDMSKNRTDSELKPGYAGVEAYEHANGTIVQFWDGYNPQTPWAKCQRIGKSFEKFCQMVISEIQSAAIKSGFDTRSRNGGITIQVEERAKVFCSLKEKHPEWTQTKVAVEAQEILGESWLTGQDVRNAYRAMKWTWKKRGKRNR